MDTELSPKAAEIVDRTRALLALGGYNGFSYADIASAVGISKPSIHHHFPSKALLVQSVLQRYRAEARVGLAMLEQRMPDPLAQLQAYTGYWAQCIRDGSAPFCICAMLAAELPAIPADVAAEVRAHFRDLGAWLAAALGRAVAQHGIRLQGSPEAEAQAFMATVHGAMLSARASGDPELFAVIVGPLMQRLATR